MALDPEFALAHATKAHLNAFIGFSTWPPDIEQIVLDSAARALELDPTLALAHSALAYLYQSRWEFDEAREAFDRAVEFEPNDPATLTAYSRFLRNLGEYEEAVRLSRRATELDPSNALNVYQFGLTLRYARDYDAAYEVFRRTSVLNPGSFNAHLQLAFTEIGRGNPTAALTELSTAEELYIATNEVADDYRFSQFAFGYSLLGRDDDVERFVGQLEAMEQESPLDDGIWTTIHLALGESDQALQRLETAIDEQTRNVFSLAEIKANAVRHPILDERRFQALRDRIGTIE